MRIGIGMNIMSLYNVFFNAQVKHYTKTRSKWTPDEIYTEAYKQAAISLGHLVKQVAGYMPNRTFVINNPSGWNIVYKVV